MFTGDLNALARSLVNAQSRAKDACNRRLSTVLEQRILCRELNHRSIIPVEGTIPYSSAWRNKGNGETGSKSHRNGTYVSLIFDCTGSEAAVGTVCIGHSTIHCHGPVRRLLSGTRDSENGSTLHAKSFDQTGKERAMLAVWSCL